MGIRDWVRGTDIELRAAELRARDDYIFSPNLLAGISNPLQGYPGTVDDRASLGVPTVYRCADLISTHIGGFPAIAYRGDDELDPPPVFRRPDPTTTFRGHIIGTVLDRLFRGFALWEITLRQPDGRAAAFHRVPASIVSIRWDPNYSQAEAQYRGAREIKIAGNAVDPANFVHIPALTPPGAATGVGVVESMRLGISGQLAADAAVRSNFTEGIYPTGIVSSEGAISKERAADIKATILTKAGTREPLIMPNGLTWSSTQMTARDSQWIEARSHGAADLARAFGVPAALLNLPTQGGSQITYGNAVSVRNDFLHTGLAPHIAAIEDALTLACLPHTQECHLDTRRYLKPLPSGSEDPPGDTDAPVQAGVPIAEPNEGNTAVV